MDQSKKDRDASLGADESVERSEPLAVVRDVRTSRRGWLAGASALAAATLAKRALAQGPQHDHAAHAAASATAAGTPPAPATGGETPAPRARRSPADAAAARPTPRELIVPPQFDPIDRDDRYVPAVVPNGRTLPFRMVNGVKVFHLIAEPVRHAFCEGMEVEAWGYNGTTPGPLIEAVEGDRVRIYVTNRLPEATTVHWHAVILEAGMDGVGGLTQRNIEPGETFRYEFTFRSAGTYMYHPHWDEMTQMALGMMGMMIVHPRRPATPRIDRQFALMLSEWQVRPGAARPNPLAMNDFNLVTFNSRVFPGTEPLVVEKGQRIRMHFGNLSPMDHHPVHLHGYAFRTVATDGGPIPPSAQVPDTTSLVPTGACRVVELVADHLGDWAMHCHMTHHVMNQMGHDLENTLGMARDRVRQLDRRIGAQVPGYMTMMQDGMGGMSEMGMPTPGNSIPMRGGPGPFGLIDMGGMFTILKVRQGLGGNYADPGWFAHPEGTVARAATPSELSADGIEV